MRVSDRSLFITWGGREAQGGTGGAQGGGWAHGVQGKERRILIVTMKFTDPHKASVFLHLPPYWKLIGSQVSIVLTLYSVGED